MRLHARRLNILLALAAVVGALLALPAVSAAAGTGNIEGTAIEAALTKHPIKGLCVVAYAPGHFSWYEGSPTFAVTNASGVYKIERLAEGSYDIRFFKCEEGFPGGESELNYAPRYYNEQSVSASAEAVSVKAGETVTGINAEMKFGAVIGGEVLGGKGQALEGVCVVAFPESEDGPQEAVSAHSGEGGLYQLTGLQTGTYKVYYSSAQYGNCTANVVPGYYDEASASNHRAGSYSDGTTITVKAEEASPDMVDLFPVSLETGAVIEGAITESAGNEVKAPMCIEAVPTADEGAGGFTSTTSGHYRIEGLASGTYDLRIEECVEFESKPVWASQYFSGAAKISEATPVSVTAGLEPPVPATASFKLVRASAIKPASTAAPGISGTAAVGQTLTCSSGSWSGTPAPTYSYQWLLSGSPIAGATGVTYVVQPADEGHGLACMVTATNEAGAASETSATVQIPVTPPAKKEPSPGTLVLAGSATFKAGAVDVMVNCTGEGSCKGTVELSYREPGKSRGHGKHKAKTAVVQLGKISVSMAAHGHETLKVSLTGKGKSLLAKVGKHGLKVQVGGTGVKSGSLLIKPASKGRHKKRKR